MDNIFELNRRTTTVPIFSTSYQDYSPTGEIEEKVFRKFIKRTLERKGYYDIQERIKNLPLWLQFACLLSQYKNSLNYDYFVDSVYDSYPWEKIESSLMGQRRIIDQISSSISQYLQYLDLDYIYWKFGFRVADQIQLTSRANLQVFDADKHIKQLKQFRQQASMSPEQLVRFGKILQFWQQRILNGCIPKKDDDIEKQDSDDNMVPHSRSPKQKLIKKGLTYTKSEKSVNEKQAATWIFNQIITLNDKVSQIWKNYHNCDYHIKINGEKRQGQSCGKAQLIQSVLILKDLYQGQKCIETIQEVQKNLEEVNQNIQKIKIFLEDIRRYLKSEYTAIIFFKAIYYDLAAKKNQTQPGANKTLKKLTSLPLSNESVKKQLEEAWLKIENSQKKNQKRYQRRKDKKREEAIAKKK